jgi:hypothetical protein
MGIGPPAISVYEILLDRGLLQGKRSAAELGSQEIPNFDYHQSAARDLILKIGGKFGEGRITSRAFHEALGFIEYSSIDANGELDALVFDLNCDIQTKYGFTKTFDLVTNHGTTEHCFDQAACFRNVHNLTARDGLMMHCVPFEGYLNHGLYNYQPAFFLELALANNYEVVGLWYNVSMKSKRFQYQSNAKVIRYTDGLWRILRKLALKGQYPSEPMGNNSILSAVLRRTRDDEFRSPYDGRFGNVSQLKGDYQKTALDIRAALDLGNFDHEHEIEEKMGRSLIKNIITRFFTDSSVRHKVLNRLLDWRGR